MIPVECHIIAVFVAGLSVLWVCVKWDMQVHSERYDHLQEK